MRHLMILLLYLTVFVAVDCCGWHLRNKITVPPQIKKIIFDSLDQNSPLSQAICHQLRLSDIKIINKSTISLDAPLFRILNSTLRRDIASMFRDGHIAEYRMTLSVSAEVIFPDKDYHLINTKVHRFFFNNPQTALAKETELQILLSEMYYKTAELLIRKLLNILLASKDATDTKLSVSTTKKKNVSNFR